MGKLIEKMKNTRCKATSALTVAGVSAMTAVATMAPALAQNNFFGTLFGTLGGAANELFTGLQGIVTPIALAAAAYCIIMMVITKDQKKLESYKQWLISIVICTVLIYAFPAVLKLAKDFADKLNSSI